MNDKVTFYEGLMVAYFSGEATPDEIRQLSAWLTEDPSNLDSFDAYRKIWLITGKDALTSRIDIDNEWHALASVTASKTGISPAPPAKAGKRRLVSMLYSWQAAAAILVLIVSATAIFYLNSGPEMVIAKAASGSLDQVLPDGTIVTLHQGSEIEFPAQFSENNREIKLVGEAYFNVKRDDAKPFIVSGRDARIEVLGTAFNVNTNASVDEVSVVLTSGRVSLYFKGKESENIILQPGEKAEMDVSQKVISTSVNPDPNYMAWKTGRIVFDNSSLDQVILTLSRVYRQEFRLGNPKLSACSLTATFDKQTLASVIQVIETTLEVKIISMNGVMVINGSGCIE